VKRDNSMFPASLIRRGLAILRSVTGVTPTQQNPCR
jgi:hypothetical protein